VLPHGLYQSASPTCALAIEHVQGRRTLGPAARVRNLHHTILAVEE
jgi:hypothetical protein